VTVITGFDFIIEGNARIQLEQYSMMKVVYSKRINIMVHKQIEF
jgi:hypothetical protein